MRSPLEVLPSPVPETLTLIVVVWVQMGQTWGIILELLDLLLAPEDYTDQYALSKTDVADDSPVTASYLEVRISAAMEV